ncbi:MAG: regulatory protein RecX [Lachnospiraceae bacterium]
MIVLSIKPFKLQPGKKSQRYIVSLEGENSIVLYKGDLSKYSIRENEELPEDIYEDIINHLLPKRAERRLLHLLEKKDYTEQQLRQKLYEGGYPESAIDAAIVSMKEYNYINDARFANRYIQFQIGKKTKLQLTQELIHKGIQKELIATAFQDLEEEGTIGDEMELALKLLEKRRYSYDASDTKEYAKQYNFLLRKGFSVSTIQKALNKMS